MATALPYTVNDEGLIGFLDIQVKSSCMKDIPIGLSADLPLPAFIKYARTILIHSGLPYNRKKPGMKFIVMKTWEGIRVFVRDRPGDTEMSENKLAPEIAHRLRHTHGGFVRNVARDKHEPRYISQHELQDWAKDGVMPDLKEVWCCIKGDPAVHVDLSEVEAFSSAPIYLPAYIIESLPASDSLLGAAWDAKRQLNTTARIRKTLGKRPHKMDDETQAALRYGPEGDQLAEEIWGRGRHSRSAFSVTTPANTPTPGPSNPRAALGGKHRNRRLTSNTPLAIEMPTTHALDSDNSSGPAPITPAKREVPDADIGDLHISLGQDIGHGGVHTRSDNGRGKQAKQDKQDKGTRAVSPQVQGPATSKRRREEPAQGRNRSAAEGSHKGITAEKKVSRLAQFLNASKMGVFLSDEIEPEIQQRRDDFQLTVLPQASAFIIVIDRSKCDDARVDSYLRAIHERNGLGLLVDVAWLVASMDANRYKDPSTWIVENADSLDG